MAQREWLARVRDQTGISLTRIAREAGLSDSTLTRFFNKKDYEGTLAPTAIQRISEITGIPGPGLVAEAVPPPFWIEASAYVPGQDDYGPVVSALLSRAEGRFAMQLRTNAFAAAGMNEGDILVIDPAIDPRDGDIVCARIGEAIDAPRVFRIYQAPYLLPPVPGGQAPRTEVVGGSVKIVGTVSDLLRQRR